MTVNRTLVQNSISDSLTASGWRGPYQCHQKCDCAGGAVWKSGVLVREAGGGGYTLEHYGVMSK